MIKTILYTINPDVKVTSFEDVENFAAIEGKYFSCIAKECSDLYGVKAGARILTAKGNSAYVLEVAEGNQEFDAKKSNITGVMEVDYPFGEPEEDLFEGLKDTFTYKEVDDVKISINGQLCVRTSKGYVTITDGNKLVRYPQGMVLDFLPVYLMPKAVTALVSGDIIAVDGSYAKVVRVADGKISAISYKGSSKSIRPIQDYFIQDAYVKCVMTMGTNILNQGNAAGGMNPMSLALMAKGGSDNLLPLLMMQGGQSINPAMLLMMNKSSKNKKKADSSNDMMQTMLMMQALGGQNPFGNLFGTAPITAPAVAPITTPVVAPAVDDVVEDIVRKEAEIAE